VRGLLFSVLPAGAVLCTFVAGVSFGSEPIAFADVLATLGLRLGLAEGAILPPGVEEIVWDLRLPRVILAGLVGGGLAVIGVAMQALVRNPLAEPYILGVSAGASTGASLFYLGFLPPLISKALSMPLAAFIGALAAMTIVYLVARSGSSMNTGRLLLAGVAVSALLAATTSFITYASPDPHRVRAVLFWMLGSFSAARWDLLALPAFASVGGCLVLVALSRALDALLLGDEPALSLGITVESTKKLLIVITAFTTGSLVSVSGIIGFVGLIIPHAVRLISGATHRRLVPVSYAVGAVFLVWADLAARALIPHEELPVGILTAICGVPFFLVLLRGSKQVFA
jgi:iron complex transport system permease protein